MNQSKLPGLQPIRDLELNMRENTLPGGAFPGVQRGRRTACKWRPQHCVQSVWSGLPVTTARKAFAAARDDLVDVAVHGETAAALKSQKPSDAVVPVRLLGEFDTYLLGHADRTPILDEEHRRRVNAGQRV